MGVADNSSDSWDDEWEESAPGSWEWLAAIGGIVVVVALFAAWLTISARSSDTADASSANGAMGVDASGDDPQVGGTSQTPVETTAPTITTTTEQPTTTIELSAAELPPVVSNLVADGQQCGSSSPPAQVDVVELGGRINVALVQCSVGRSRVFEVAPVEGELTLLPLLVEVYDASGRVVEESADLSGVIGIDEFGSISLASSFRDGADCGVVNITEWNGARFELTSASGRLDCEATGLFAGAEWPVIYPPTERGPCVPGEATLGEGDVIATQILDVDGDGLDDLLTLTQRGAAGFVRVATATGQVFQAGIGGSTFAADQVVGVRDLDGDGFAELFVGATQGDGIVDMVLTKSQCGWVVAGELASADRQVSQPSYRCTTVDSTVEILVSTTTVVPDTDPARFLHLTERFRLVEGALAIQRVDRVENEQAIIDPLGSACT